MGDRASAAMKTAFSAARVFNNVPSLHVPRSNASTAAS
jgi:hypothetical protein